MDKPLSKEFKEDKQPESAPILSKYKKPSASVEKDNIKEEQERLARIKREKQRMQGRVMPSRDEEDHERGLVLIATKGVV